MERYVVTNASDFRLCQPEIFSDPLTEMLRNGAHVPLPRRCADNIPASRTLSASGAKEFIAAARFGQAAPLRARAFSARRMRRGPRGRKIPIAQTRCYRQIAAATSRAGTAAIIPVPVHGVGHLNIRR
jgi:hypothetical protein